MTTMMPQRLEKLTKVVATISDKTCTVEFLKELYDAGMNVVRINTAHTSLEGVKTTVEKIRAVSEKIGIMLDTKGPELRTTAPHEPITYYVGQTITIDGNCHKESTHETIHASYGKIVEYVPVGTKILVDDGALLLEVIEKNEPPEIEKYDHTLTCKVLTEYTLVGRKTINIPDVHMPLKALTNKDREYVELATELDITFIAHSFVRNKNDVLEIQKILDEKKSPIKIIAKIENQEGVDNIDEILDLTYGIMVARGDLGVEIAAEKIPLIQKNIILKCRMHHKPVIIATQMMKSMVHNPRPTRAEVNDVANAIYDGTDAVMLSEETAIGKYPVETISMVTKIAREVESTRTRPTSKVFENDIKSTSRFLAHSAILGSEELDVHALIIDTQTGRTPRMMASFRGNKVIHARCYDKSVMAQLSLSYSIFPGYMEPTQSSDEFIHLTLEKLLEKKYLEAEHKVLVVAGNYGPSKEPSFLEISTVKDLLHICNKKN